MEFCAYPKTPRLEKPVFVTEKIDGTNAQVVIESRQRLGGGSLPTMVRFDPSIVAIVDQPNGIVDEFYVLRAGSRRRWITPEDDNFGFAAWVRDNATDLAALGTGRHYGEWWGRGIQRGYGLDERRFSLFNAERWVTERDLDGGGSYRCADVPCCHVVPVIARGTALCSESISLATRLLELHGSQAAPGFDKPEGAIVFHTASRQVYKVFCKGEG